MKLNGLPIEESELSIGDVVTLGSQRVRISGPAWLEQKDKEPS